jgi:branched-chain amino acid transport system substrate-binding protein
MSLRKLALGVVAAATLAAPGALPANAADEVFIPLLVYRTGPYAPSGIPIANGMIDYFKLLNERDGGIGGAKVVWEECETQYDTKLGVECYERLKGQHGGALVVNPYSTAITYALIPKAPVDKVVIHSMGYGRTDAADGRVFPWVFNMPTTYWSQASAIIEYIAGKEGGFAKLKDKKITLVYHNSAYGKEPIPTLETLSKKYGYKFEGLAVNHPGLEQGATWLQIRRNKPNYVIMWGWGVMNQVAIKEAASIGFPMDHFIGGWWSGSEDDVQPAGKGSVGYTSATFTAPGTNFPLFKDLKKYVYDKGQGTGKWERVGEVLYNRAIINAVFDTEAIRIAQKKFNVKAPNAEQVRWGFEHFDLTEARLKELGLPGFTQPIKLSCLDHEGNGPVMIQQWDGKNWKPISKWITPMRDIVRPAIEASARSYAQENNITPRDCSKEQ